MGVYMSCKDEFLHGQARANSCLRMDFIGHTCLFYPIPSCFFFVYMLLSFTQINKYEKITKKKHAFSLT
jgi:hypothetical protein